MRITMKYTGTTNSNFTNGQNYLCLGFADTTYGLFVDDAGLVAPGLAVGAGDFDLVSVVDAGDVTLFLAS